MEEIVLSGLGTVSGGQQMANTTLEQVLRLAGELSPGDPQTLAAHLTRKLHQTQKSGEVKVQEEHRAPQDHYGIWRGRFPDDLDIDGILHELRHEWEAEWPEVFQRMGRATC